MSEIIVQDPEIMGGTAVFRGTRVPVETVFEGLKLGMDVTSILAAFPSLNEADVRAVIGKASKAA
jgi:uncharacterized protein (DUF433 family)